MKVGIKVGASVGIGVGGEPGNYTPTVAATLDTTILSGDAAGLLTDGTPWAATLRWSALGVVGNGKILNVRVNAVDAPSVEVRDNERYDHGLGWVAAAGTVGIRIGIDVGLDVTVGEIETAINASSSLASVTTPDPSSTKKVDPNMDETTVTAAFSGGV